MPKAHDEKKRSGSKLDRRAMMRTALAVGGASALVGTANAAARPQNTTGGLVAEREWARTLARHVANQLPEAARQLPELGLTADQVEQLKKAFENTLVTNMGCALPPERDA